MNSKESTKKPPMKKPPAESWDSPKARAAGWDDRAVRRFKRDRPRCRRRPHQTIERCVGFPSSATGGARNLIPGGGGFFGLASGGNLLKRPCIWICSGCLEWGRIEAAKMAKQRRTDLEGEVEDATEMKWRRGQDLSGERYYLVSPQRSRRRPRRNHGRARRPR
jgi:hypothetical protein